MRLASAVRSLLLLAVLWVSGAACGGRAGEPADAARRGETESGPWVRQLASDSAFGRLHARLSGSGGYFDTDNLISNEASYLHVIGQLDREGAGGGAYLGVGPDQNFSYIAAVRPAIAFIVDIRRDNVLQHLMFKALLEASSNRLEYLCLLVGRVCADNGRYGAREAGRAVDELVEIVDAAPGDPAAAAAARRAVAERVARYGITLTDDDRATIERFHSEFIRQGLDLRFSSHGRRPRFHYPTLRQLLLERDRAGRQRSYVASREAFRFVKSMSDRNLIMPVVGDLAGPHALAELARLLEERDESVSTVYVSNVEFYLWRQGRMEAFLANLERLPRRPDAMIIRSYFGSGFRAPHPERVPGYVSTQLLEPIGALLDAHRGGRIESYWDLVTGDRGPAVGDASSSG